jgi:hypothetical protein
VVLRQVPVEVIFKKKYCVRQTCLIGNDLPMEHWNMVTKYRFNKYEMYREGKLKLRSHYTSYTTYTSAMQHISALSLSSLRWKFLHRNSERYVWNSALDVPNCGVNYFSFMMLTCQSRQSRYPHSKYREYVDARETRTTSTIWSAQGTVSDIPFRISMEELPPEVRAWLCKLQNRVLSSPSRKW